MRWRVVFQFQRISSSVHNNLSSAVCCKPKMPYYAVARGRSAGIYQTWAECESQVKGFSGARYKKFDSPQSAQEFINENGGSAPPRNNYHNYKVQYHAGPSSNNNNLKRNFSTISNNQNRYNTSNKTTNSRQYSSDSDSSSDSDDSDDLATKISKQMDDIEKRANTMKKGLDKIYKNAPTCKAIMIEPPAPKKQRTNDFEKDHEGFVKVYTDGACSQNGRAGARAGLGVYWGEGHAMNTSKPVSGRATNNCGEIQAATCAIKQALSNNIDKLAVYTDSKFLINSVTKWMPGWKSKGWKLASGDPVKNEIDFKDLDKVQNKLNLKWVYVEAHKGVPGNEKADQLARAGAEMYQK